jgi:hypothetical protein
MICPSAGYAAYVANEDLVAALRPCVRGGTVVDFEL